MTNKEVKLFRKIGLSENLINAYMKQEEGNKMEMVGKNYFEIKLKQPVMIPDHVEKYMDGLYGSNDPGKANKIIHVIFHRKGMKIIKEWMETQNVIN